MSTSKKSIITDDMSRCFVCGRTPVETHHVCYGTANRTLSDRHGLIVGLCYNHHRGKDGVHNGNKELDMKLKRKAQEAFIEHYPEADFLAVFGRNYL